MGKWMIILLPNFHFLLPLCLLSFLHEETQSKTESGEPRLDSDWAAAEEPGAATFISTSSIKIKGKLMGRKWFICPLDKQNREHCRGCEKRAWRRYNLQGPTCDNQNVPLCFSLLSCHAQNPEVHLGSRKKQRQALDLSKVKGKPPNLQMKIRLGVLLRG